MIRTDAMPYELQNFVLKKRGHGNKGGKSITCSCIVGKKDCPYCKGTGYIECECILCSSLQKGE